VVTGVAVVLDDDDDDDDVPVEPTVADDGTVATEAAEVDFVSVALDTVDEVACWAT
jgi:hypothetical protein